MHLEHFFLSPKHIYFGHHGKPPGETPMVEVERLECVAGRGLREDRFFDYKDGYKGQATFFSQEIFEKLCQTVQVADKPISNLRRNIIVSGVELNELIGEEFEVQGVHFLGAEECRPCYWMDQAIGPGAEAALKGHGGLRVKILSDGWLRLGPAELRRASPTLALS